MDTALREYLGRKTSNLRTACQITSYASEEDLEKVDEAIMSYYLPIQKIEDCVMNSGFVISVLPLIYGICHRVEDDGCKLSLYQYMSLLLEEIKIYHQKIDHSIRI